MNKIFMLSYVLIVVDVIERNQQKQTSYQTAAAHRQRRTRFNRPISPICRYQRICGRYGHIKYCWPQKICTI